MKILRITYKPLKEAPPLHTAYMSNLRYSQTFTCLHVIVCETNNLFQDPATKGTIWLKLVVVRSAHRTHAVDMEPRLVTGLSHVLKPGCHPVVCCM